MQPAFYPEPVESLHIISLYFVGKQRWMYTLNGFVVGTPTYGNNVQADGSKLVYVLHNVKNIGQFTILMENSNGTSVRVLYNEVSKDGLPFSPMTKIRSQLGEDMLYWVSTMSTDPGYDPRGRIHRVIVRPSLQIIQVELAGKCLNVERHCFISIGLEFSDGYKSSQRNHVSYGIFNPFICWQSLICFIYDNQILLRSRP